LEDFEDLKADLIRGFNKVLKVSRALSLPLSTRLAFYSRICLGSRAVCSGLRRRLNAAASSRTGNTADGSDRNRKGVVDYIKNQDYSRNEVLLDFWNFSLREGGAERSSVVRRRCRLPYAHWLTRLAEMLRPSMQRLRATAPARRRIPPPARNVHTQPTSSSPPPPRPPPPKYIRFATVYPFILLSIITSLALNLSVQRTARETEGARHRAQISVLEKLIARLRSRHESESTTRELTEAEQDEIERELELVGLGRGRGKEAVSAEMSVKTDEATSWKEVFLGKKGKGYEPEDDKTDWEAGAYPLSVTSLRPFAAS
jgi:hypothetical protein